MTHPDRPLRAEGRELPGPRRILMVEDNPIQAPESIKLLRGAFPDTRIELLSTEKEFRDWATSLDGEQNPRELPDVVLMEVMLRWADVGKRDTKTPPPDEVVRDRFFTAGFRCARMLLSNPKTEHIPIVFVTLLNEEDIRPFVAELHAGDQVTYVSKSTDQIVRLPEVILRLTQGAAPQTPREPAL